MSFQKKRAFSVQWPSVHPEVLTDVSTLPPTGCLGCSDLYLGNQSGENRNVGRKLTRKSNMIKGTILILFIYFYKYQVFYFIFYFIYFFILFDLI